MFPLLPSLFQKSKGQFEKGKGLFPDFGALLATTLKYTKQLINHSTYFFEVVTKSNSIICLLYDK